MANTMHVTTDHNRSQSSGMMSACLTPKKTYARVFHA